jgi:hypothetical protein
LSSYVGVCDTRRREEEEEMWRKELEEMVKHKLPIINVNQVVRYAIHRGVRTMLQIPPGWG